MKRLSILTIGVLLACTAASPAQFRRGGSCGPGGCSTGGCASGQCSLGLPNYYQPSTSLASYIPTKLSCPCAGGGCQCPGECLFNGCVCSVKWIDVPGADQKAKYVNNIQVGAWDESGRYFRSYNARARTWGEPVYERPADLPAAPAAVQKSTAATKESAPVGKIEATPPKAETPKVDVPKEKSSTTVSTDPKHVSPAPTDTSPPLTGMTYWALGGDSSDTPQFSVGGTPVTESFVASIFPGEKDKPWVGYSDPSPTEREKFARIWATAEELKPWQDRRKLKLLDPADPMLKDREGKQVAYASPGVWFVRGDGFVEGKISLEECDTPETLAGALYRIDPQFDPNLVPDPLHSQPASADSVDLSWVLPVVVVIFVIAVGVFLLIAGAGAVFWILRTGDPADADFATAS